MSEKRIEDLNPTAKTVLQSLKSAIQILENKEIPEKIESTELNT